MSKSTTRIPNYLVKSVGVVRPYALLEGVNTEHFKLLKASWKIKGINLNKFSTSIE